MEHAVPPRVTVTPLDSLLALNLAIARASACDRTADDEDDDFGRFFEHSGVKPSQVGEYSMDGSFPLAH